MPAVRKKIRRRRPDRVDQYESQSYRDLQARLVVNVRAAREAQRWTQEQAAEACLMATRLFQRVEAGDVNLTLTSLARLCVGLDVDMAQLFRPVKK